MSTNRFHAGWSPVVPHLAKGKEVGDLRLDLEEALSKVAEELSGSVPVVEVTGPETITGSGVVTIKVLDAPEGDLVGRKVILAVGLFLETGVGSEVPGDVANTTTITGAVKGIITTGAGSAAVSVQTDATGECQITLTGAGPETVIVACRESYGGPSLNCVGMHGVQVN